MPVAPSSLFQGVFVKGYGDGTGFHADAGQGAGVAVDGQYQAHDGVERADCFVCASAQDVGRVLGIDGSVGAGNLLGSFQAKVSFANSINMTTSDVVIIAAAMQQETYSGTTFRPRQDVQYYSVAEGYTDHQRFTQVYGTQFISEIVLGGRFFAYFKLAASSVAQKQQTMAALAGSIGGPHATLNANASAQLQASLADARRTQSVESSYTVLGGQQVQLGTDGELLNFALKFPSLSLAARAVMSYQVGEYRSAGMS